MNKKYILSNLHNNMKICKLENCIFFIFLLLYFIYLIFLSYKLGLSYDEPFSLNTTDNKLSKVVSLSYYFEGQPPAYFIILSVWRKINDSILFARLLSILFTLLSASILDRIIRVIFDKTYSKWIIVLFLANPFTIWASLEIRLYSMLILLTLLYTYLFCLIYFHNRTRLKIILLLVGVLGVYTQYYFTFLIMSFSIVLLFKKRWSSLLNYIILSAGIALLFMPNLLFIKEQYSMHQYTYEIYTLFDKIRTIISAFGTFFIPTIDEQYILLRWSLRIIFVILFIICFVKLYVRNKRHLIQDFRSFEPIIILSVILTFIFITIYSVTNLFFSKHYLTIAYPFYILLFLIFGIYLKKRSNIFYSIYAAYYIFININQYKSPYIKSFDYKSITNFIHCIQMPKEPILIKAKTYFIGFKYYYSGEISPVSLPEVNLNYNFYKQELKDTVELNHIIKNINRKKQSFLLVSGTDIGFLYKINLTNEMIDTYLKNNYITSIDTTFNGINERSYLRIRRLTKKYR